MTQFFLGFRESDVQATFPGQRTGAEEMQSHGGFAGSGFPLEQKHMAARQATGKDVIQTYNADGGLCTDQLV
ncbi:hypothetical protein BR1R3_22700 [Pseudomonas atacamensis]|nr:hypothetical protein BR1R3_22700 [Pseudomonas atacamensis]